VHTSLRCPPTVNKLPPPETARWGAVRKATVVRGVQAGLLTLEEAYVRYSISADEFAMWEGRLARHGIRGLRVHGLRDLRSAGERNLKEAFASSASCSGSPAT
jgi:Protein of unknown function (DUF1153)